MRTPIIQRGYTNVAKAYNDARPRCKGLVVYLHHDVFLPVNFEVELMRSVIVITRRDPRWGVLGIAGCNLLPNGTQTFHGWLSDRGVVWKGRRTVLPHKVETLDELLLITRGDFVFDEQLPANHFYGADICMQAQAQGRACYAIRAFVTHNSGGHFGALPADFEIAKTYFAAKWRDRLPIATTCTIVGETPCLLF
jgi:hypothetical protein